MKLANLLQLYFDKLFITDKWNIGYVNQTPESLISLQKLNDKINWLAEDKADYAADPFITSIKGRTHIFYEELNFWQGRGEIMVTEGLSFKRKKKVTGVMDGSIHLSYPYLLSVKDKLYCIPETSGAKQVALYQVDKDNPQKFKKIRVILRGEDFVDSSIIYYQDKYWLFTSLSGKPGSLYIYCADTLLSTFKAHALNPIAVGDNVSRSAGSLFTVNQKLYMPSQNPEQCYGGSIMINEITSISETEFQYQTVFELLPQQPYGRGLHTISFADGLLIVDGKRSVKSMFNPIKKIVRKIRSHTKPVSNVRS
ncbi:hypothetical protein [Mucilaginibacter sp. SP1R1]|uniref:glucosamine inositolphosphorylceramide transferase family protein n=1 Tax=Mucilaginibacter sp. SP1R1 TaxID=2723091 RepID=UPI001622DF0B|nr:hypothetical protein [Mucilaginibacter sp. SP1R1]MBB6151143.1 hypothetical protein [Mucilaginibacter sp. SP1R1]